MRRIVFAIAALCWVSNVQAWPRHGNPAATGSAQLNLGGSASVDISDGGVFMNFFKTMSVSSGLDITKQDSNGYPNSTLGSNYVISYYLPSSYVVNSSTNFVVQWKGSAGSQLKFIINDAVTLQGACTNASSSGGSNSALTVTTDGVNTSGSCTYQYNSYTGQRQGSFLFPSGFANVGGVTDLAIVRQSDLAAYNAAGCQVSYDCYLPEFISALRTLNPYTLRFMDWNNTNGSNEVNYNYRTKVTNIGWRYQSKYPNGVLAGAGGACGGTDTYTATPNTDFPSTTVWTDGEVFQCTVTNANTVSGATLAIGSRSAKTIIFYDAVALSAGSIASGSFATFVYDAVLDKLLYKSGGITATVPLEAMVALANRVRSNFWYTYPAWADDTYVSSVAAYVRDNLNTAFVFYPEFSNEVWNNASGFGQTGWATARGTAMGFSQPVDSYYALRTRQIMGTITPIWASRSNKLRRTLMIRSSANTTTAGDTYKYRMAGQALAPSGVGTGQGNATYNTFTGSANYTASPDRPIDYTETTGYAPYAGGVNYCTGPDIACTPGSNNVAFYNSVIAAWDAGNATDAIALVDGDINAGSVGNQTVTASGTTFTTPADHGFTAGSTRIGFSVTGGTTYSGIATNQLYLVHTTPTSKTFTMQAYTAGVAGGADVDAGSAGSGSTSVGSNGFRDMRFMTTVWYPGLESLVSNFDAGRATPLRMELYEGNLEPSGPTTAQCTSLGLSSANTFTFTADLTSGTGRITGVALSAYSGLLPGMTVSGAHISGTIVDDTTFSPNNGTLRISSNASASATGENISVTGADMNACSSLQQALTAWKNSSSAFATTVNYFKQFMGTDTASPTFGAMAHSKVPSWFILPGPTVWSMTPGGFSTTPYQTYYGFSAYRGDTN